MAQILTNQRSTDGRATGQIKGPKVVDSENQNTAVSSHNIFPMSYPFGITERYGEISPFFVFDAEARDVIPLDTSFQMRTLATQSPIMQNLKKTNTWYQIDKRAIMPRTYELIYKAPVVGDDVPADSFCNIFGYNYGYSRNLINNFKDFIDGISVSLLNYSQVAKFFLRYMFFLRDFYSDGSLLASLGCPLHGYYRPPVGSVWSCFDEYYRVLLEQFFSSFPLAFKVPELNYRIYSDETNDLFVCDLSGLAPESVKKVTIHRIIEILSNYDFEVVYYGEDELSTFVSALNAFWSGQFRPFAIGSVFDSPYRGINLERLVAYQLTCAQYYTNDNIDYIYNADLWHKAQDFFVRQVINQVYPMFEYNDIQVQYDAHSEHVINLMFDYAVNFDLVDPDYPSQMNSRLDCFFDFFANLMSFNRSLKFLDYFTGAKARPLGVGDVDTQIQSGAIDTLELVHNIQLTRFLNAINRSGMRDIDYLQQIYRTLPSPDYKEPKYIVSREYEFASLEVVNTSDDQGNVTSYFRTSQDGSETRVQIEGYPCILLGVTFYEMMRLYVDAIDRDFFMKDRFDFFNPYFQYDGDQEVYLEELHPVLSDSYDEGTLTMPFAYHLRDMHRKLRIPRASGGFVRHLPSWAFLEQDAESGSYNAENISPEFILSSASEFDRFFTSLTGITLGDYFHFELFYFNRCNAIRPMEYSPAVLNG